MSDFNHEFLEIADIVPAFVPVDMQTGTNNGIWIAMKNVTRLVCVLFKAAGTVGDNPVITLQQATGNAGAGAKALPFTRARTKIGPIASTPQWSIATQSAANTYTPTSAASQAMIAVEVQATDLDLTNGYAFVQLSIPDTGTNAQLGAAFYIAYGLRYPQNITPSSLT
ncbi:hypothetical protein [Schlesneria paludicola]|uniref:hypothetical protein n=1 Tax=Schlesneria paludicola TaxID=360056 RepID=UPI00029AB8E8|nr:hypothetical protein [Schlesneria paludicola]